jgi:hypothetical protein
MAKYKYKYMHLHENEVAKALASHGEKGWRIVAAGRNPEVTTNYWFILEKQEQQGLWHWLFGD